MRRGAGPGWSELEAFCLKVGKLRLEGLSTTRIGERLGLHRNTVNERLRRYRSGPGAGPGAGPGLEVFVREESVEGGASDDACPAVVEEVIEVEREGGEVGVLDDDEV